VVWKQALQEVETWIMAGMPYSTIFS
jgi:hypothetical protein